MLRCTEPRIPLSGVMADWEESGPLLAGDIGPDRDWPLDPAGDSEGEGEGPVRADTWEENGERDGVPWSP